MNTKKSSRIISLIFCLAIIFSIAAGVSAAETVYEIPYTHTTVTLPEGASLFLPDTSINDPKWEEAGIEDPGEIKNLYSELGVCAHFSMNGGKDNIYVDTKTSEQTRYYFNLNNFNEKNLQKFADVYNTDDGTVHSKSSIYKQKNIPFVRLDLTSEFTKETASKELIYFTIVNGSSISFRMVSTDDFTEDEVKTIESVIDSFNITEVLEQPNVGMSPIMAWGIVLTTVVLVVVLFVITKKQKNGKSASSKRLAEKLAKFRSNLTDETGECLYVNETTHTAESIRNFSKFQAYKHHPFTAVLPLIISILGLVFSFILHATWWVTLIISLFLILCIYQLVNGAGQIEKSIRRVFGKLKSDTAHYEFYDDQFIISGIQKREVFPYFRITEIAENGEMLYLYCGEGSTYFIDKTGFTLGDPAEFKKFIDEKIEKEKKEK